MKCVDRRSAKNLFREKFAGKPQFFKVLLGDFERRLRIPQAFLKHICDKKSERVTLRDLSGSRWRVKLSRTSNDLYLQDGWEEFSKAHSLKAGEFLVFRYDGYMRFHVNIFAANACQREDAFALTRQTTKRCTKKPEGFEQKKDWRSQKHHLKTSHFSRHPQRSQDRSMQRQRLNQSGQKSDSNQAGQMAPVPFLNGFITKKEIKAKEASYRFTSPFPYFVTEMKLTSVQRPFQMTVPRIFSRQHLPKASTKMTLRNAQGATWRVNLHVSSKQHLFCGGWKSFSQGNDLRRGDHCVFELLDELLMQRIPRAFLKNLAQESSEAATLEGPSGDLWHVKLNRTKDDVYLLDGWETFRRDHSLEMGEFLVFEYDGNLHFRVQIFSRNGCVREDALTVKCSQESAKPQGKKRRSSRLKDFEEKKRARPCTSTTTSPESIHPSQHSEDHQKDYIPDQSESPKVQVMGRGSRLPSSKPEKHVIYHGLHPIDAARSFTSSSPYFTVEIKAYSVGQPFHLNIPLRFSKMHCSSMSNKMFLQNLEGKRWTVKLHKLSSRTLFCGGWRAFSEGNNLKKGDYCIFELVNEFKMKVHIFRVGSQVSFTCCGCPRRIT